MTAFGLSLFALGLGLFSLGISVCNIARRKREEREMFRDFYEQHTRAIAAKLTDRETESDDRDDDCCQ